MASNRVPLRGIGRLLPRRNRLRSLPVRLLHLGTPRCVTGNPLLGLPRRLVLRVPVEARWFWAWSRLLCCYQWQVMGCLNAVASTVAFMPTGRSAAGCVARDVFETRLALDQVRSQSQLRLGRVSHLGWGRLAPTLNAMPNVESSRNWEGTIKHRNQMLPP